MKAFIVLFLSMLAFVFATLPVAAQVPQSSQVFPSPTHVFSYTGTASLSAYIVFENRAVTPYVYYPCRRGDCSVDKYWGTGLNCQIQIRDKNTGKIIYYGKAGTPTITGVSSTTATKDSLNRKWFLDNL